MKHSLSFRNTISFLINFQKIILQISSVFLGASFQRLTYSLSTSFSIINHIKIDPEKISNKIRIMYH